MTIDHLINRVDALDPRLQAVQRYFFMMTKHPEADQEDQESFTDMLTWAGMSRDILSDIRASALEEHRYRCMTQNISCRASKNVILTRNVPYAFWR